MIALTATVHLAPETTFAFESATGAGQRMASEIVVNPRMTDVIGVKVVGPMNSLGIQTTHAYMAVADLPPAARAEVEQAQAMIAAAGAVSA